MKPKRIVLTLALFIGFCFTVSSAWGWTDRYLYRRVVNIDNSGNSSALTNYQVVINITNVITSGKAQSNGSDLACMASDDQTEIGFYFHTATSNLWAKVPLIPASSTQATFYIYYGKSDAENKSSLDTAFTKDYSDDSTLVGQWNMDEESGTNVYDSSGKTNDGAMIIFTNVANEGTYGSGDWDVYRYLDTDSTNYTYFRFHQVISNTLIVSSNSGPSGLIYSNGVDYTVDYDQGKYKALPGTRIPDEENNPGVPHYVYYNRDNDGPTWLSSDGGYWGGDTNSVIKFTNGASLRCDGADDWIKCSTNSYIMVANLTAEAWIFLENKRPLNKDAYPESNRYYGAYPIVFRLPGGGLADGYYLVTENWKPKILACTGAGSYPEVLGSTVLSTGVWYHIAGVINTSTSNAYVYVNGQLDGSNVSGAFSNIQYTTPGMPLYISASRYYAANNASEVYWSFDGQLDEVRVYDRALSQAEIRCHFERRKYASPEPTTSLGNEEKFPQGTTITVR